MSSSLPQHLSILFAIITTITYSHHYTTFGHVSLSPRSTSVNRTTIITNPNEVTVFNNEWIVNTQSQNQWQFIIQVDEHFGFLDSFSSSISVTLNTKQIYFSPDDELLFGITSTNDRFISFKIPFSPEQTNQIYPSCNPSKTSSQLFATGDISSLPDANRVCDIAGGSCTNWDNMLPTNTFTPTSPITFTFENHPLTDTLSVYFHTSSFPPGFYQTCYFGNSFETNNGLKIYMSGNNPLHSYTISSFDIQSSIHFPTPLPTLQPSMTPTKVPTNQPSVRPTGNPTINPTDYPTTVPTIIPTFAPTNIPSLRPTFNPTITPTNNPTFNPSINPTNNPTKLTQNPTLFPTNNPVPNGYKLGAYNQLCVWNGLNNNVCNENTDILSNNKIVCFNPYDCCLCKRIQCGFVSKSYSMWCNSFVIGTAGIYGVKDINIYGNPNGANGVHILCEYYQSCKQAVINAYDVSYVKCDGSHSCQHAIITITNPKPNFMLECAGFAACQGLEIYIDLIDNAECEIGNLNKKIFEFSTIKCANVDACNGMNITINNRGCDIISIGNLECIEPDACHEAVFNFIGDVFINNCHCSDSCQTAIGLNQCFEDLQKYQCSDPFECREQMNTIINVANGFEFICNDVQSCEKSNFVIQLNSNIKRQVTNIKGLFMSGLYSGRNATFTFENNQAIGVEVDNFVCGGLGSCNGFELITGVNVVIDNIICAANACYGCKIKQTMNSPGLPCDPSQLQM